MKITDEEGKVGWGEGSLEGKKESIELSGYTNRSVGHTQAVEGCLDAYSARITGMEAECVQFSRHSFRWTIS